MTHGSGKWGFGAIELAPRSRPDDRLLFDELTVLARPEHAEWVRQ